MLVGTFSFFLPGLFPVKKIFVLLVEISAFIFQHTCHIRAVKVFSTSLSKFRAFYHYVLLTVMCPLYLLHIGGFTPPLPLNKSELH